VFAPAPPLTDCPSVPAPGSRSTPNDHAAHRDTPLERLAAMPGVARCREVMKVSCGAIAAARGVQSGFRRGICRGKPARSVSTGRKDTVMKRFKSTMAYGAVALTGMALLGAGCFSSSTAPVGTTSNAEPHIEALSPCTASLVASGLGPFVMHLS